MFCDLVGSTAMSEVLDPEDLQEVLLNYQQACAEVVERLEGHIAQYLGDGILVYFGYPRAHEDDAYRAVLAGIGMLEAIETLNRTTAPGRDPLSIRIGIHTGLVVTGEIGHGTRETLALGQAPNIAARIQGTATPNTIVVSSVTQRLTERFFDFEAIGSPLMKGVSQPLDLYRVIGKKSVRGAFGGAGVHHGEAVGRSLEVDAIKDSWQRAVDNERQTVIVSGEAGIGKSRLVSMFLEEVDTDTAHVLVTRCSPYSQSTAFAPFAELLRDYFDLNSKLPGDEKLARIRAGLEQLTGESEDLLASLCDVLDVELPDNGGLAGLPPDQRRQRITAAIGEIIALLAKQRPLVLVVEDLHWADPSSLDVLQSLHVDDSAATLLLIMTFRSSFESPFEERDNCRFFKLDHLSEADIKRLVAMAAAPDVLAPDVVQLIADRADGIPLFAEELTQMLLVSGQLKRQDGMLVSRMSLDDLSLPSTIHSSLVARLDRLGPARKVAQHASVMGREFNLELLGSVCDVAEEALRAHVDNLVGFRILVQSASEDGVVYNFRHALIRDAAYETLLKREKTTIHGRIATTLTERFPELAETRPEVIAYHHAHAGDFELALTHWQRAGQRASGRFANAEAIRHYGKAVEMIRQLPETEDLQHTEVAVQTALGSAISIHHGWQADAAGDAFERAFDLCQSLPEAPEQFWVLWQLAAHYLTRDIDRSRDIVAQLVRLAELADNPDLLVEAQFSVGAVEFLTANFDAAEAALLKAVELLESTVDPARMSPTGQNIAVNVYLYLGQIYTITGRPMAGLEQADLALDIARRHAGPPHQASALCWKAFNLVVAGMPESVLEIATEALALSEGSFVLRQWALMLHGWALAHAGQHESAQDEIREAGDAYHAAGIRSLEPWMFTLKADALLACAEYAACRETLERALASVADIGETFSLAELHRISAESLSASREFDRAAEAFEKAAAVASQQGASTLLLNASLAHARVLAARGLRGQAQTILARACEAMPDGDGDRFPMLREAREYLVHLS